MKKVQQDRESMTSLTSKTLTEAPEEALAEMPGISVPIAALAEKVVKIRENAALQIENRTGSAVEKGNKRELMVGLTIFICRKGASYAFDNSIPVLLNKVNIVPTYLSGLTETNCAAACKDLHDVILPYLSMLSTYGVTAGKLADQNDAVNAFNAYKNDPREQINVRKTATAAIARLLGECDEIFVGTDIAVGGLEQTQPDFCNKYFQARQIINTGGRTISLHGKITTADEKALKGVRILIHGDNMDVVKKSTAQGNFQVKHLLPGMYKVSLSKVGMVSVDREIAVNANERSELVVTMDAIALNAEL